MLEHLEFQSEDDPPDTSGDEPSEEGDRLASLPTLNPTFRTTQLPSPKDRPADNEGRWYKDRKYVLELFGFIVLFAYTWFACLQWLQIRWTNRLTKEALDGSNTSVQQTLAKMDWQIRISDELAKQALAQAQQTAKISNDTHDLAVAAGDQSTATQTIAVNTGTQSQATQDIAISSRPWVGIVGDQITVTNPPSFLYRAANPGNVDISVSVVYEMKNTGSSTARRESASFALVASSDIAEKPNNWQQMACQVAERVSNDPSRPARAIIPTATLADKRDITFAPTLPITPYKRFWITGCIVYQDSHNRLHHTRVLYRSNNDMTGALVTVRGNPLIQYVSITGYDLFDTDTD